MSEEMTPPFPSQGILYDRAGFPVDATGWVWTLNTPTKWNSLEFTKLKMDPCSGLFRSIVLFFAERVQIVSSDDLRNTFYALCYLRKSSHFQDCVKSGNTLDERLFVELREISELKQWRLHYVRAWYRWCAQQALPQFSTEVARTLERIVLGTNERGRAVRTQDPINGALDELEFFALTSALRSPPAQEIAFQDRTIVWLSIALGCNPLALSLLREDDYRPIVEHGTDRIQHMLYVPRIKKGSVLLRDEFHPELLNEEIGSMVAELIRQNQAKRTRSNWPEGCAYPIFVSPEVRSDLLGKPMHSYAMHITGTDIALAISRVVTALEVRSHRTGEALKISPRRLRRTFATRAVEEGASPAQVAFLLDHQDLQTVMVYFESRSSQAIRLETGVAVALAPIAKAFMGRLVKDETHAINGGNRAKRIQAFRSTADKSVEHIGSLGTCGSGPCGLYAPVACYVCDKFQAWKNGPHREYLDFLCAERERRENEGLDPKIVGIIDRTILAVGEVIAMCEEQTL